MYCKNIWFVLLFSLILSISFQGSRGLYDFDETRYAEVAREMLLTGDYLIPKRDFHPHLSKPPFTYWMIAISMKILGINEWAVRLPNALFFSLTSFLVALIGQTLWDRKTGILSGLIYSTTLLPYVASNIVTTDTILVFWETVAVFSFLKGYLAQRPLEAKRWFTLMWLFWGFGFLTKGVAIGPPIAALFLFWIIKRKEFKALPLSLLGTILFFIIGFTWYIWIVLHIKGSLSIFLKEQIIGRLFKDIYHRNSAWYAPFYLYLPLLTLGVFPWFLTWPVIFRSLKDRNWFSWEIILRRKPLFLFLWFTVPLFIFWFAKSRLPLYILPLFTPLVLITTRGIQEIYEEQKSSFVNVLISKQFLISWAMILILLKFLASFLSVPQDARYYSRKFAPYLASANCFLALDQPYYDGMAFYTGIDWEYLSTEEIKDAFYIEDTWKNEAKELKRISKKCLILVRGNKLLYLKDKLHNLGLAFQALDRWGKISLYEISFQRLNRMDNQSNPYNITKN